MARFPAPPSHCCVGCRFSGTPRSKRRRLPFPMRPQAAVASQKRGLEVPGHCDKDVCCRAKLTHGPPKTADVHASKHGHLLTKQPAEERYALRQFIHCPPNAALLDLGGGRGPRALVRPSEPFVQQRFKSGYAHAAVRHHPRRDHAPGVPATRAKVTLHDDITLALRRAIPPVTPMLLELLTTPAFRAVPRSARTDALAQRRLINLHRPDPTETSRSMKSPPGPPRSEREGASATAFSPTARSLPLPPPPARSPLSHSARAPFPESRDYLESLPHRSHAIIAARNTSLPPNPCHLLGIDGLSALAEQRRYLAVSVNRIGA